MGASKPGTKIELDKGRRTRVALVVEPAGPSSIRLKETFATAEADLQPIYDFGKPYHVAHWQLRAAWTTAYDALMSMGSADRVAMRGHVHRLNESAMTMEQLAATLEALPGVEPVAALIRHVLVAVDELGTRGHSVDDLDVALNALRALDVQRSAELVNVPVKPEVALLARYMDATGPLADGDIGVEAFEVIEDEWRSAVATHAWRSAGLGIKWDVAWDTWWQLDRFKYETIGAARGKSDDAVAKSRGGPRK